MAVRAVHDHEVGARLDQRLRPLVRLAADADRGTDDQPAPPSFAAFEYFSAFTKSLTVIRPLSTPASSTSGSFSILWRRSSCIASSPEIPTLPVTSGIGVMTSRT
ncbi:hypothetical protein SANTM175S_06223 [Streptomyces antimycoticus]